MNYDECIGKAVALEVRADESMPLEARIHFLDMARTWRLMADQSLRVDLVLAALGPDGEDTKH